MSNCKVKLYIGAISKYTILVTSIEIGIFFLFLYLLDLKVNGLTHISYPENFGKNKTSNIIFVHYNNLTIEWYVR